MTQRKIEKNRFRTFEEEEETRKGERKRCALPSSSSLCQLYAVKPVFFLSLTLRCPSLSGRTNLRGHCEPRGAMLLGVLDLHFST